MNKEGKVYIVGAGPGDWELISLKAVNKLRQADVVYYDFLASKELLKFARENAQVVCVGKTMAYI